MLVNLDGLDLAALISSRICHDIISPVGAVVNGLEMYQMEKTQEMRDFAFDLVTKSANTASSRLQFCRMAFGAAGSAGAAIDTREAEKVALAYFESEKAKIEWKIAPAILPKNRVKLVLNMLILGALGIPRGGTIVVNALGFGDNTGFLLEMVGQSPRIPPHAEHLIRGEAPDGGVIDAHAIQPFYTGLLARQCAMQMVFELSAEKLVFRAV
jgi:histidine phosphotransferase ChpT